MTRPVVAVTGGNGFLGRHVAASLVEAGWQVRLLVRRDPVRPLPEAAGLVPGDLDDAEALARLVRGASAVVHAAGLVKARSRTEFLHVNRDGAGRVAAVAAREAPGARFVLVSSLAARMPGLSAYADAKRAGEAAVRSAGSGLSLAMVRPGVIYGPGDREGASLLRLSSRRFAPVPAAPEPVIAMIHARDAAAAIVALCRSDAPEGLFELSDARSDGYRWSEIVRAAGTALGRVPRLVPLPDLLFRAAGTLSDGWAAASSRPLLFGRGKAREILHRRWGSDRRSQPPASLWTPRIDLPAGLADMVAWWRANAQARAG